MKNILLIVLFSMFGVSDEFKHTTFNCIFTAHATSEGSFNGDKMEFSITTNDNNGTYNMKKDNVVSYGRTIKGDKLLSFIAVSKQGNISTTTMTALPPYEDKQKAVYSINGQSHGKLLASQYYGTCQMLDKSLMTKVSFPISKERRQKIILKLDVERKLKSLPKKDVKYILDALNGVFPSRQEMEDDMSLEGMILVSSIMEDAMKIKQ